MSVEKYLSLEDEYRDLVWEEKEKGGLSGRKEDRLYEIEDKLGFDSIMSIRGDIYPDCYL